MAGLLPRLLVGLDSVCSVGSEGSVSGRRHDAVAPAAFRGEAEGERREEDAG